MNNEFYYLQELELKMDSFIEENCSNGDFGWMPDYLSKRMAQASTYFILLATGLFIRIQATFLRPCFI